jgi:hypothetical protein
MPRNQLTKEEIRCYVQKLKSQLFEEQINYTPDPKGLANKYLNRVLDRIEEYYR